MQHKYLLAVCGALMVAGCGSTASPTTGGGAPAATSPAGGGASGGNLTVTGSLSVSVNETSTSSNKCQRAPDGMVSAILEFDAYSLQFSLAPGNTHFPNTSGTSGVAFFNNNDSSMEWAIGTSRSASAAGTVTVAADGKSGIVDVDMMPNPPSPNPALHPIHVKGTFTCT